MTVTRRNVTRVITDLDLVHHLLMQNGVSLERRWQVRRSGQVREWLDAGHTKAEMLSLARVGDRPEWFGYRRSA
jgi:hypothetical protein